jgi:hypothetical protein
MGRVASSLFSAHVCRFRNRCRRPTQLCVALSSLVLLHLGAPWCKSRGFLVCPHCNTAEVIFIPPPPSPHSNPFAVEDTRRGRRCCDGAKGGGVDTSCSGNMVFILSLVLIVLAVVGIFVEIPFVSMYAFWVAVLAYVVLALGNFLAID